MGNVNGVVRGEFGTNGGGTMKTPQLAEFVCYFKNGKAKHIYTDDPQKAYDELIQHDVFFVCYPGDFQIPRNRK